MQAVQVVGRLHFVLRRFNREKQEPGGCQGVARGLPVISGVACHY